MGNPARCTNYLAYIFYKIYYQLLRTFIYLFSRPFGFYDGEKKIANRAISFFVEAWALVGFC